jgi:hypothetical protein
MQVAINEPFFTAAGLTFTREGDTMRFTLPDHSDVAVAVVNDQLHLIPERSAAHRALIAAIGLEPM